MNEFFRVWMVAKSKYNLTRIVNKSIFKGYSMKIYSDERLIVSIAVIGETERCESVTDRRFDHIAD